MSERWKRARETRGFTDHLACREALPLVALGVQTEMVKRKRGDMKVPDRGIGEIAYPVHT